MKVLVAIVAAMFLAGCAAVGDVVDRGKDRVADRMAEQVIAYCERYTEEEQEVLRARFDERTHPHSVRVYCDSQ